MSFSHITNIYIQFSFDKWVKHPMVKNPDESTWYYALKEKKSGMHQFKLSVESSDHQKKLVETYDFRWSEKIYQ
jgi:hypothetical protein